MMSATTLPDKNLLLPITFTTGVVYGLRLVHNKLLNLANRFSRCNLQDLTRNMAAVWASIALQILMASCRLLNGCPGILNSLSAAPRKALVAASQ